MSAVPSETIPEASGYQRIKALAKAYSLCVQDLLVLARGNNPFFSGVPAHVAMAE